MNAAIRYRCTKLLGAVLLSWGLCGEAAAANCTQPEDLQQKNRWVEEHLLRASSPQPPFSFVYGGEASGKCLTTWPANFQTRQLGPTRVQHTLRWVDDRTGLEVRLVAVDYRDFPAVEWTVYLRNTGTRNTPILQDIRGLDASFQGSGSGEYVLRSNKGDCCAIDNYQPYEHRLVPSAARRFTPVGGRPTSGPDGWPYYQLQIPGSGLLLAVGWPGQWATAFIRDSKDALRITAGQERTHLALKPGEEVRTPLIALLFWQGNDTIRAQNLWRQWFMAYTIPRRGGNPPEPFLTAVGNMGDIPGGEGWYRNRIDAVNRTGLDWNVCWVDAGWYPCRGHWEETGTWEIDLTRYPQGFKRLGEEVHAKGKKLVVWFEPERVRDPGSWLAANHPQWLLGFDIPAGKPASHWPQGWDKLLNIGDSNARAWAIEHFDRMIKAQGIDVYRQDFNIEPLPYWQRNDPSDRQGITENLYVQGYLGFLDGLLARNPNLWMDVSASGGRRNDLETLRRALPLRRSDYEAPNGSLEAMQTQTHSLSSWLPYYGVLGQPSSAYAARSGYLPALVLPSESKLDSPDVLRVFREYPQVAPLMLGDFYPLTRSSLGADQWIAWQFHRPENEDGVIQAFRRARCDRKTIVLAIRGLDATAQYELTDFDAAAPSRGSGKELMEKGLTVVIKDQPGAAVIVYKRLTKAP